MKRKHLFAVAMLALMLGACSYQNNNTIKQLDVHANDPYIYGVHPDSAARQTKLKYAEKVESEARAQAVRDKLKAMNANKY